MRKENIKFRFLGSFAKKTFGQGFGELYVQLCDKFQHTDDLGTFQMIKTTKN